MYKLVLLLKRVAAPLLFLVVEIVALSYYTSSTSFTRARLLSVSNSVVGSMNASLRSVGDYFSLRDENRMLTDRVVELESQLARYATSEEVVRLNEEEISPYLFTTATVVRNSVFGQNNFFTINKGLRDDVEANMAVLTPEGYVAGYVVDCSERYSVCMSMANTAFTMGGKARGSEYMGSVAWDGGDYRKVKLTDVPYYAAFKEGDTIVSTVSYRFPPDRVVGVVEKFEATADKMNSEVVVRLAADLSRLDKVLVVKYLDGEELHQLEELYEKHK
jgi:rod shape-determining protein MreC